MAPMGGPAELRHLQRPAATASASAADHRFTAGPEGLELVDLGLGEFDEGVLKAFEWYPNKIAIAIEIL